GAVGARRYGRLRVASRPAALPELPRRDMGAVGCSGDARARRPLLAHALAAMADEQLGSWQGEDVSIGTIERRLAELRHCEDGRAAELRTSVMTHIAWVPEEWEQAATQTRSGLGARHPSRAIVLYPR